uniref:Protein quiver n=1 Tax=Globodera pallida TaxID=36090 RepID=A0A183BJ95_GLOPA
MCVLLMLLAALLHATSTVNAFECLTGVSFEVKVPSKKASNEGSVNLWNLTECPAGVERCMKVTCTLDTKAMREIAPGKPIPDGVHSTITAKGCMERGKCEIPDEVDGKDLRSFKKYCDASCCTGNLCNGTLGLRSFGTFAAMIACVAAFFVRWN